MSQSHDAAKTSSLLDNQRHGKGDSGIELDAPLSEDELQRRIEELMASDPPPPAHPMLPKLASGAPPQARIKNVQAFIEEFEYNYTGNVFFGITGVRGDQSLTRILNVARNVIKQALPIKCVEAVYLGILCSQKWNDVCRVPLIFYSTIDGHTYGHIVLAMGTKDGWGAIGLSRRKDLMDKPVKFNTLLALVEEFRDSYKKWGHKLFRVKCGAPIPHEGQSTSAPMNWAHTIANYKKRWKRVAIAVDQFEKAECKEWRKQTQVTCTELDERLQSLKSPTRRKPPAKTATPKKEKTTTASENADDIQARQPVQDAGAIQEQSFDSSGAMLEASTKVEQNSSSFGEEPDQLVSDEVPEQTTKKRYLGV